MSMVLSYDTSHLESSPGKGKGECIKVKVNVDLYSASL